MHGYDENCVGSSVRSILALLLKHHKPEYGIFLSLGICIFIFFFAMDKLSVMISYIRQLQNDISLEGEYVGTILKMIGITYLAEFASNICKDAGYTANRRAGGNFCEAFHSGAEYADSVFLYSDDRRIFMKTGWKKVLNIFLLCMFCTAISPAIRSDAAQAAA